MGGVSVIDPSTMKVTHTFLVSNCSPAGLTLGPRHQALIGCSAAFNNKTQSVIIDITSDSDAVSNTLDPSTPTSTTAHSVAADENSHFVFVPIGFVPPNSPVGTDPTNPCPADGCIAVYQAHSEHADEEASRR